MADARGLSLFGLCSRYERERAGICSSSLLMCYSCSIIKNIIPENNTIDIVLLSYSLTFLLLETPSIISYIPIFPTHIKYIINTYNDASVIPQPLPKVLHQDDGEEQTGPAVSP